VAAEYEVNIKLNTGKAQDQLKDIEASVAKIGKTEKQSVNTTDRRIASLIKLRSIGDDVAQLEQKGVDMGKARFQLDKASEAINKKMFLTANSRLGVAVKHLNTQRGITKELERQQNAQRRQRIKRAEGVALGAGFPLLFGGGAGSVIGGALGGLTGSFGAQIALSAIGQQIDQFVASMVDAGKALTSVGGAADFMAEKSLFSSDAMQFRIEKLIEEGNATEAAALMTQEMAKQVGGSGLKALKDLGTEANEMGKLFNTLMVRIQAFMAQALTPLISLINRAIGSINARSQLDQMLSDAASPEQRAQILQRSRELRGTKRVGRAGIGLGELTPEVIKQLQADFPAVIPEGAAIQPTQLELLRAADAPNRDAEKAKRKAEREQLRAFLELNKQITVELDRQDEINAMNGKHIAEQLNTADKISASQEKRAGMLEARLNGTEKEFKLNQAIKEIKEKGLLPADEERLIQAERQIHAMNEQVEIFEQQEKLLAQIGQTVKSGLVDGIMAALDGTRSLSESLAGVLRQLASMFMQVGISSIGQGLKIPGFANGGSPPVGRPSIVGERGPELFVPKAAGTIVPNHALGGANVVVNVDASGTQAQGNQPNAKALGAAIGAAVQVELVKQKRPGGLLS
jgi:hypothetical protein